MGKDANPKDPLEVMMEEFLKKPRRERYDMMIRILSSGGSPIWLSTGTAQALMMQDLIESSLRLEGLTRWLIGLTVGLVLLTVVLAALTGVQVYDVARRLIGN